MGEVKAKPVTVNEGACLLHMGSKNRPQRFLQQMGGAVVFGCRLTLVSIHAKFYQVSYFEHSLGHFSDMADLAAQQLDSVFHCKFITTLADDTGVGYLAAAGSVERGFLHDNRARFPVCQCLHKLFLCGQHRDLRVVVQRLISHESGCDGRIDGFIYCDIGAHVVGHLSGFSGHLALLLHGSLKSFFVDVKSFFLQYFLRQIQRKSIGVV